MSGNQRSFAAAADVGASLFITLIKSSGVNHGQVRQSTAGEVAFGVSQDGTREAPIPGVTPLHAVAGEGVYLYELGDPCEVLCAEAINAGNYLKPDDNGKAVVAFEGEHYSAQAVSTTANSGEKVKVTVKHGIVPGTVMDSVTATGSAQNDAAALAVGYNTVLAADGTKGVVLPAAAPGKVVEVYNAVATNGLKIYPASGGTLNGGSANAAIAIEGKTLARLVAIDTTNWAMIYTLNT